MTPKPFLPCERFFIPLLATLSAAAPASSDAAESAPHFGVDAIAEAGVDLHHASSSAHALNGFVLAHGAWSSTPAGKDDFGFSAYASVAGILGVGPSEAFAGNLLTASNIEGRRSARVYSWWLEGRQAEWSLRAGALLADEEFTGTQTGANFLNSAFGWPAFISANTVSTGPAFYVPAIGVRLRRELGDGHYFQIGIYDGDTFDGSSPRDEATHYGLRYRLSRGQGQFAIAELGGEIAPVSAQIKIGAWLHTADFEDVWADENGGSSVLTGRAPRVHGNNFGGFAVFEKNLAGKPGEPGAVSAHLRGGLAPTNRNAVSWSADASVAWHGPLASRPADTVALGAAWLQHSDDFARRERDANPSDPTRDHEAVFEATYNAVLTETFSIHPSVQFIHHPGGSGANREALIGLLRMEAHF